MNSKLIALAVCLLALVGCANTPEEQARYDRMFGPPPSNSFTSCNAVGTALICNTSQ
jgi:hypothetical protein